MPPDANPYVGPRPFETADADFFFGRDREVSDLVALIVSNPVVLLYAASGAGKSSLLNAAVVGRLERDQQCEVFSVARVRGLREEDIGDRNVFIASVLSHLTGGTSSTGSLRSYLAGREHAETDDEFPAPRALVIDQLEELFTAYPERWADRPAFFEDLAGALRDDPLLRVVLSIREDFLAQLDPYARLLPDGLRARYRLERLSAGAALHAAKEPARRAGRPFADGVAEQLVQDLQKVRLDTELGPKEVVGEYVEPVQLQVACRSVWEALPESATEITEEHRERFGNVDEVLGTFYDEAIGAAATAAHTRESTMRSRFAERFITPLGTRGTVFWTRDETGGIPAAAIKELDDRHLVRAELRAGARWYELTHDRLIEPIRASNRAFARRRAHRRRRAAGGVAVIVGAAAAVVVGLALSSSSNVRATTVRVLSKDQIAENQQLQRSLAESRGQLATALARTSSGAASVSKPHVGDIRWLNYSADGGLVAAGSGGARTGTSNGSSALWIAGDTTRLLTYTRGGTSLTALPDGSLVLSELGGLVQRPVGHVDDVTGITLSSEGRFAAAVDRNGVLRVLKISGSGRPQKVKAYRPRNGVVYETPAFGESSAYVVFVGSDGYVRRAFTGENRMERVFLLPPDLAGGVALSADGNLLAAYGSRPTIALLDLTGKVIGAFPGGGVVTATFSPSGDRLATAYDDGSVRIWRTLPDLGFAGTLFPGGGVRTTLVAEVANVGGSASRRTSLDVSGATVADAEIQTHAKSTDEVATRTVKVSQHGGHATISIPALGAGKHATLRLHVKTLGRPITLLITQVSAFTEQSYDNNAKTVIAPSDTRARIVAAALAGVAHSNEIRYDDSTLHATMQGVLDKVHLPNVPKTSTTTGFVTWCYREGGAPDPNGRNYKYASGTYLRARGTKVTTTPQPGDLVFYVGRVAPSAQPSSATALYVGNGDVVTFVRGHPARIPLATLGLHTIRKYPLRATQHGKHAQ
jgi:WD40 repeat protein